MITHYDMVQSRKVLEGDRNWRDGPAWPGLLAFFFGRRERFVHLGMHCTVAWWKGQPYLISLREAQL